MVRRRFRRLLHRGEVFQAGLEVETWGYPRELDHSDYDPRAQWYRFGEGCTFWVQLLEDQSLCIHVAVREDTRIRHGGDARRLLWALEFLGDMAGARRLIASDCAKTGQVASYLGRMGFTEARDLFDPDDPIVWYEKDLTDGRPTSTEDHST